MRIFDSFEDDAFIDAIINGAVGVMPTDTTYGLVASARHVDAVQNLYRLKFREHKPGTVIAANIDQLVELGIKRKYLKAVEQFWPGAVSVETSHTVAHLHQGTGRQAFRIPAGEALHKLLVRVGPLVTSSANLPGEPPAHNLAVAQAYFGDAVGFYVEGGNLSGRLPSTIIRIVDDAIEVIRQGAVKIT